MMLEAIVLLCLSFVRGAAAISASPLPSGVIKLPIIRIQNQTQYGAEFQVGTPPQRNVVIADTGSAEVPSFMNKSSLACQQNRCQVYGTYDNLTSSTAKFVSNDYGAPVGPDPAGAYVNDTLRFGGHEFPNLTIGKEDFFERPNFPFDGQQAGFLGLGNYCNLTASPPTCQETDNLLEQLHRRGNVDRRFFGLYLGKSGANATGSIIFNGIDKAKQATKPFTVPMSPSRDSGFQTNLINMTATNLRLKATNGSVRTTSYPVTNNPVLADSGTHDLSLDQAMAQSILDFWNVKTPLNEIPFEVDCKYRRADPANAIELTFNNGSNRVSVPLSTLINEYAPRKCGAEIEGYGFGVIAAPLLRGLYATFDLDKIEMTFSEVNHTSVEQIVKA